MTKGYLCVNITEWLVDTSGAASFYRSLLTEVLALSSVSMVTVVEVIDVATGLSIMAADSNMLAAEWSAAPSPLCLSAPSSSRRLQQDASSSANGTTTSVIVRTRAAPADYALLDRLLAMDNVTMARSFEGEGCA